MKINCFRRKNVITLGPPKVNRALWRVVVLYFGKFETFHRFRPRGKGRNLSRQTRGVRDAIK